MIRAAVLGGAASVWDDFRRLERMCGGTWPGLVVTVNDAHVAFSGRVDHFVTQHAERVPQWKRARAAAGGNTDYRTWGCLWRTRKNDPDLVNVDDAVEPWGSGSSGLHAVTVLRTRIGADRIALCGVPLTESEHFPGALLAPKGNWPWAVKHRDPWENRIDLLLGPVRSMGGWTQELLGCPDPEWLRLPTWDGGSRTSWRRRRPTAPAWRRPSWSSTAGYVVTRGAV